MKEKVIKKPIRTVVAATGWLLIGLQGNPPLLSQICIIKNKPHAIGYLISTPFLFIQALVNSTP